MRMIDAARSTIHITTYILGRDEGSQALVDLPDAAGGRRRGGPFAARRRRFVAHPTAVTWRP